VAPDQKKTSRLKATLVFIDESGLMMAPWVRRSWAPRGRTPVLRQRTRSRRKVSVIAGLGLAADRHRVRLVFRLHPDANLRAREIQDFLGQLVRHFRTPLVVLWDRLAAHRSATIRRWLQRHRQVHTEFFPPYAPDLNPVELVWAYLKTNGLANLAPQELTELTAQARRQARRLQDSPYLLRSMISHCPLSLRLR